MTQVSRDYASSGETFTQDAINTALATMPEEGFARSALTAALGGSAAAGRVSSYVLGDLRSDGLAEYNRPLWMLKAREQTVTRTASQDYERTVKISLLAFMSGAENAIAMLIAGMNGSAPSQKDILDMIEATHLRQKAGG